MRRRRRLRSSQAAARRPVTIEKPDRVVGQAGTLDVTAGAPGAKLTALTIALEQNGKTFPLFTLDGAQTATVTRVGADQLRVTRPIGKQERARAAVRPGADRRHRDAAGVPRTCGRSRARRRRTSRFASSRRASRSLSTKHYVNHGGSEMVVYRATPPDVASGVRVGEIEYPGFPAPGQA